MPSLKIKNKYGTESELQEQKMLAGELAFIKEEDTISIKIGIQDEKLVKETPYLNINNVIIPEETILQINGTENIPSYNNIIIDEEEEF